MREKKWLLQLLKKVFINIFFPSIQEKVHHFKKDIDEKTLFKHLFCLMDARKTFLFEECHVIPQSLLCQLFFQTSLLCLLLYLFSHFSFFCIIAFCSFKYRHFFSDRPLSPCFVYVSVPVFFTSSRALSPVYRAFLYSLSFLYAFFNSFFSLVY